MPPAWPRRADGIERNGLLAGGHRAVAQQRGGRAVGEPLALAREVRLVGVTRVEREPREACARVALGEREEALEPLDPDEGGRAVAHGALEAAAQLALAERDEVGGLVHRRAAAHERERCLAHQRIAVSRRREAVGDTAEQLGDRVVGRLRPGHAILEFPRSAAPQLFERDAEVQELVRGHAERRARRSDAEADAEAILPGRSGDVDGLGRGTCDDQPSRVEDDVGARVRAARGLPDRATSRRTRCAPRGRAVGRALGTRRAPLHDGAVAPMSFRRPSCCCKDIVCTLSA